MSKLYDLNVVTTLKMQPHYSRSSRENAIPFSGTSPLPITRKYSPPSRRAQLLSVSGYNIAVLFTFPHQILCMGRRSSFFYFMRIFLSSTLSQRFLSDTRTKCRGLHFMAWHGAQISQRDLSLDTAFTRLNRVHKIDLRWESLWGTLW